MSVSVPDGGVYGHRLSRNEGSEREILFMQCAACSSGRNVFSRV